MGPGLWWIAAIVVGFAVAPAAFLALLNRSIRKDGQR